MKLIQTKSNLVAGIFMLAGAIIGIYTNSYNKTHIIHPKHYGKWIAVLLPLIGLFFAAVAVE